jgi:putative membrane protein
MTLHLSPDLPKKEPRLKSPLVLDYDGDAADPAAVAPVPETGARAVQLATRLAPKPRSAFGRFALWVFSSLFALVLSVSAWNFVTGLFAANSILGWIAFALFGAALFVLLILALREASAFARMARIDRIRMAAISAREQSDLKSARAVLASLNSLYASRAETAWGRARLTEREAEVFDADALLSLAETELLAPLDRAALAEVESAARQVATVTAFVPLALADVATALYANLRLIRRLSQIYGGRSGGLGSARLMRRVFAALLGAGAIALADDLIGSVASGGVLAKLSRRFGEGVVNGALTARVGLAAMELSRPLPFVALPKPGTSATTTRALAGLFSRAETGNEG